MGVVERTVKRMGDGISPASSTTEAYARARSLSMAFFNPDGGSNSKAVAGGPAAVLNVHALLIAAVIWLVGFFFRRAF